MNIDFMRSVDRFIGVPLCWSMGFYFRLSRRKGASGSRVQNILVIKFFGLGSILLATPALSLMKREFPEAHIAFLSFGSNAQLLERLASIDTVLTIDNSSVFAFVRDIFRTIRLIRRIRPELAFDFEFFSKFSTLVSGLSGAPIRAAFSLPTQWRTSIVTHQVPLDKGLHVVHSFCEQVVLVSQVNSDPPPIEPPQVYQADHDSLLRKFPVDAQRIVVINVNAGHTFLERRWPANRFSELVSTLAVEDDCVFCFIGNSGEFDYVSSVIRGTGCSDRCINTAGSLSLPELAALLQRSEVLVSNDSGPLHLAAALGIPTVGLYGPESPEFYGAFQSDSENLYKGISCSPCMNIYAAKQFRCPYDAQCMKEISVDQVLSSVRSLILVNG